MIKKELEKQNFNENKKQSNSKSIEIKKYIEIQLKDIDEEMTLNQFENTLKYFSIIEKSLNEDTFLIDKCEIKKENNETFYLTSKLKEFLFDALDNSNKNKVTQKVTESLDRFYMKEMKNQLKLSDVINREIQHFAGSEIINKSENYEENYEEKKEKTKLTTLDDNEEEENSNDENKKGLVDRATQTPKIRGLENISLMIEEQNNDQNDDEWNKMKEDSIVLSAQNERLTIDNMKLSINNKQLFSNNSQLTAINQQIKDFDEKKFTFQNAIKLFNQVQLKQQNKIM